MQGTRDIRRRIRSVRNTQQITKAMKMVAAAKLRKTQGRTLAARPYLRKTEEVIASICAHTGKSAHPLMQARGGEKAVAVVVAADRGLCGGYNSNLIRAAYAFNKEKGIKDIIAVGRKARDFFKKAKYNILNEFLFVPDYPEYSYAKQISEYIQESYISGKFDEVYLIYTESTGTVSQRQVVKKLLPLDAPEATEEKGQKAEYIFEPEAEEVLGILLPKYVDTLIYKSLLEAKTCEFAAKMAAMSAATDNASEMINKLTLSYNRARQAAITKEISEIVGGAEALK